MKNRFAFLCALVSLAWPGAGRTAPAAGAPAAVTPPERLRIISLSQKTPDSPYLFAYPHGTESIPDLEGAMGAARGMGFNAIWAIQNDFRSEDGSGVSWREDLTPDDPQFTGAVTTDEDRRKIDLEFRRFLASARRHGMKIVFNVGTWLPQTWFRAHPDALSRLPDGAPCYDWNFGRRGVSVCNPCFRSGEFRAHSVAVVRAWLGKYGGDPVFRESLCRVAVGADGLRMDPGGLPLFFIHQDTFDREWCCCARCREGFREHLRVKYGTVADLNRKLGTAFAAFQDVPLAQFPHPALPGRVPPGALWHDASEFWTQGVLEWKEGIVREVRGFFPDAEVAIVTKYPVCPLLTDFKRLSRGSKIFYTDPYPMEGGMHWNLPAYLFDIEVYGSAAEQNGQVLLPHLQGFENPLPKRPTRAPTPAEFKQQHIGLLARGLTSWLTLSLNKLQVDLSGPDGTLLPEAETAGIVRDWHRTLERVEGRLPGTSAYGRTVVLRYNPRALCSTDAARGLYDGYTRWKARGAPVRVVWDDASAAPEAPESFEFALTGDPSDWDLVVRKGADRYLVFLTNLRDRPRAANLSVALEGQDMTRWTAKTLWPERPAAADADRRKLSLVWNAEPCGCCVLELAAAQ